MVSVDSRFLRNNSANFSCGVCQPKVCLGRSLNSSWPSGDTIPLCPRNPEYAGIRMEFVINIFPSLFSDNFRGKINVKFMGARRRRAPGQANLKRSLLWTP